MYIIVTLEELGLKRTKKDPLYGPGERGYDHAKVVKAFQKAGLRPVESAHDLIQVLLEGFVGYVPDKAFFEENCPRPPYFGPDCYRDEYLWNHGCWPQTADWLLQK